MKITYLQSMMQIDRSAYERFYKRVNGTIFYDYAFLLALEEKPLLPHLKTFYLLAQEDSEIVGWLPVWLQTNVDPFKVLSTSLGYPFTISDRALFSHVMHVSDSQLLCLGNGPQAALLGALSELAKEERVLSHGLLNLTANNAQTYRTHFPGSEINFMWNRFTLDLRPFSTQEEVIAAMNADGRHEANRQRRNFYKAGGSIEWRAVHEVDLHAAAVLCQQTTERNGTPHYYPLDAVTNLLLRCADFTRVVEIRQQGRLAGVGFVFFQRETLWLWAVGMDYAAADFSPYTLLYLDIYRYALAHNIAFIEAGRTTQRIKERLGFHAVPLYSLTRKGENDV